MSAARPPRKRRWLRWLFGLLVAAVLVVVVDGWKAFGHRAEGERRARMERSAQWKDGHFENPEPMENDFVATFTHMLEASPDRGPKEPLPVAAVDPRRFDAPAPLRVTWFGHSSMLVEIDGHRVLTDPAWSERASPLSWIGPKRWYPFPVAVEALPAIDAVVVSHDHYDHLDYGTIVAIAAAHPEAQFVVPLGIGAHLEYWGIPEARITELDWWETARVRGLDVVAVPARHASGRVLFDFGATLWAGYALVGPEHRAYFSGDTGLFPAMQEIGERLGPFDVTMIETGQYDSAWPDWHIGPEQAVVAHRLVRGKVLFPMHWALFTLAYHGWTEPIERTLAAASKAGVKVLSPTPGQSVEPGAPPPFERWWPDVPWKTGTEQPVVSTKVPDAVRRAGAAR